MTCANDALPLLLPWSNISVSTNDQIVRRGIRLSIGTPEQVFSLKPATGSAAVWVYDAADCLGDDYASCVAAKGGVYNQSESSTFVQVTNQTWNGTLWANQVDLNWTYFEDTLHRDNSEPSPGFPFLIHPPKAGELNPQCVS